MNKNKQYHKNSREIKQSNRGNHWQRQQEIGSIITASLARPTSINSSLKNPCCNCNSTFTDSDPSPCAIFTTLTRLLRPRPPAARHRRIKTRACFNRSEAQPPSIQLPRRCKSERKNKQYLERINTKSSSD